MTQILCALGSRIKGLWLYMQFNSTIHYIDSVWLRGFDLYNYVLAMKYSDPTYNMLVVVIMISNMEIEKNNLQY